MKKNKIEHYSDKEALEFHNSNKSGKIEIISSKPSITLFKSKSGRALILMYLSPFLFRESNWFSIFSSKEE